MKEYCKLHFIEISLLGKTMCKEKLTVFWPLPFPQWFGSGGSLGDSLAMSHLPFINPNSAWFKNFLSPSLEPSGTINRCSCFRGEALEMEFSNVIRFSQLGKVEPESRQGGLTHSPCS